MLYGLTAWRLDLQPRCCTICSGAKLSSSTSTWSEKCAGKAWPRHLDMVLCPSMSYVVLEPCEIPQIISLPYLILHVYCPHARTSEPVSFRLFVFYQQVRVASFKTLRISKTIIRIEISSLIASVSKLKKNLATSTTDEGNVDALGRKLKHNLVSTCCTSNGNPIGISIMSYTFNFKSCVGLVFSWKASLIHANDCIWFLWILMVLLTSFHGKTWQNQWSRHLAYSNGGTCVKWHRRDHAFRRCSPEHSRP